MAAARPPATLPTIVAVVRGQDEAILEDGARCRMDILQVLILGATPVSIGQPYPHGLATNRKGGLCRAVQLSVSLRRDMALLGAHRVQKIISAFTKGVSTARAHPRAGAA